MPREYDIIVYGATGFTGQLVAKYLHGVGGVKWAAAGRDKGRVEARLAEVGVKGIPIVVADSTDAASLDQMCKATNVVISLVGPYIKYGEPLVKAAAENGTAYVDLTGEAPFCAKMIQKYGRTALGTKALLIHSCGFDSIPGDLTAFLAVEKLKAKAPSAEVGSVKAAYRVKGGASGGTIASVLEILEGSTQDKKVAMNPYGLSPVQGEHKPKPVIVTSSTFAGRRTWGAFWVMGSHNGAIVRRSWGILETSQDAASKMLRYGPKFAYDEFLAVPVLLAPLVSFAFLIGFTVLALFPPARWALRRFGPQPGTGPSEASQINGWFRVQTTAKSVDGQHEVQVVMKGKGDPGYLRTATMISECALAIALDRERLPPIARSGGFLTPATALGHVLVERLENTGHFSWVTTPDNSRKTK